MPRPAAARSRAHVSFSRRLIRRAATVAAGAMVATLVGAGLGATQASATESLQCQAANLTTCVDAVVATAQDAINSSCSEFCTQVILLAQAVGNEGVACAAGAGYALGVTPPPANTDALGCEDEVRSATRTLAILLVRLRAEAANCTSGTDPTCKTVLDTVNLGIHIVEGCLDGSLHAAIPELAVTFGQPDTYNCHDAVVGALNDVAAVVTAAEQCVNGTTPVCATAWAAVRTAVDAIYGCLDGVEHARNLNVLVFGGNDTFNCEGLVRTAMQTVGDTVTLVQACAARTVPACDMAMSEVEAAIDIVLGCASGAIEGTDQVHPTFGGTDALGCNGVVRTAMTTIGDAVVLAERCAAEDDATCHTVFQLGRAVVDIVHGCASGAAAAAGVPAELLTSYYDSLGCAYYVGVALDAVNSAATLVEACANGTSTTCNDLVAQIGGLARTLDTNLFTISSGIPTMYSATLAPNIEAGFAVAGNVTDLMDALDTSLADVDTTGDAPEVSTAPDYEEPEAIMSPVAVGGAGHGMFAPLDPTGLTTPAVTTAGSAAGCQSTDPCAPPLVSGGGPVEHNPRLYAIYWGPKWNGTTDSHPAIKTAVNSLLGGLSGSSFQSVLNQYYDASGHVGNTVTFAGQWVDTTLPATQVQDGVGGTINEAQVRTEVARARSVNHWPSGTSVQFLVLTQSGMNPYGDGAVDFKSCGWHNSAKQGAAQLVYAVLPHPSGQVYGGCASFYGNGNAAKAATFVTSHEYAEAATDPLVNVQTAWVDGDGEENGDMCNVAPAGSVAGQWATQTWSNASNSCSTVGPPLVTSYSVVSVTQAPGSPYTPGHSSKLATVVVKNTGNTVWNTGGSHPVRLGTWPSGRVSHVFDDVRLDKNTTWLNPQRVKAPPIGMVRPGDTLAFHVALRPDGSYAGNAAINEQFSVVIDSASGATWATRSAGAIPTLSGTAAKFGATALAALPTGDQQVVAGTAGTDVAVQLNVQVKDTAIWYGNEVMYLGTASPYGRASSFRASTWPKGPCGNACRAVRMPAADQAAPSQVYTFKFTVHIPATKPVGQYVEAFGPVADVPIVGGGVSQKYLASLPVRIVVLPPSPVGTHSVTGTGVVGSTPAGGFNTGDATNPAPYDHWFACAAVGDVDAVTTQILSCSASTSGGAVRSASSTSSSGPVAMIVGTGLSYDSSAGDTAQVCWTVRATYADGTSATSSDCSG
jgi:hypothetical protein